MLKGKGIVDKKSQSLKADKIQDTLDQQLISLPKEVVFCRNCVVPNQRPRIIIDEEGTCSACRFAQEKKSSIDWEDRARQLKELFDKNRRKTGKYDIIVPGSGGKDSSSVAHKIKHWYNMHPLTVT